MTNMQRLVSLENECSQTLSALCSTLCNYIRKSRMEELSEKNTVSAETWRKYGSMKSPNKFFLPDEQAKIVEAFMKDCNNAFDFKNRLRAIYRKQEISDFEAVYPLNPATLKAIETFAADEGFDIQAAWSEPKK